MNEKNGIILVVVIMAIAMMFAVATFDTPKASQPEKSKVVEPVEEPKEEPASPAETTLTGQAVYLGHVEPNAVELQFERIPFRYAITEGVKAELDKNPELFMPEDVVVFGYELNEKEAPYAFTITWMALHKRALQPEPAPKDTTPAPYEEHTGPEQPVEPTDPLEVAEPPMIDGVQTTEE